MTSASAFWPTLERFARSSRALPNPCKRGARALDLSMMGLSMMGLSLVSLIGSSAWAQTAGGELGAGAYQLDTPSLFGGISLAQDLSVNVPLRLGLYLHRPSSTFPQDPANTCYLAGQRDPLTGNVTFLDLIAAFAAATYNGDGVTQNNNAYSYPGEFRWGSPALTLGAPVTTLPLLCLNRTVVSTFINKPSGWRLTALYQDGTQPLLMALHYPASPFAPAVSAPDYLTSGVARSLSHARGTSTVGWQDGFLLEGMVFEGGLPTQPLSGGVSFTIADLDIADLDTTALTSTIVLTSSTALEPVPQRP